jgi:hypothetical protein
MFGLFRKRREHLQRRELQGLMSCLVAWHRAGLEGHYQDGVADSDALEEKRSALGWYAHAADGTDPFTNHILQIPVGELEEPLFLEGLYRIETAVGIAWALRLIEAVPPTDIGADFEALSRLFPLDGPPAPSIRDAKLREQGEILDKLTEWKALTASARKKRDESHQESTAIPFSRAFERTRGLAWVCDNTPWIEDIELGV